jgi:DNA-binding IclR family transcriptional regulator
VTEQQDSATEARSTPMRSLNRAIQIFEQLQRYRHPQRLKVIADDCGMSSSTALRLLRVLCDAGLVAQLGKSYRIGPAVVPASRVFLETDPLPQAARPVLARLAETTGFTASLFTRLGDERILIERAVGNASLGYELPQGRRLPLTRGAAGRVLISGLDDAALSEVLTASQRLGYEDENAKLADLKRRMSKDGDGFSFSEDERQVGIVSVAVLVPTIEWPTAESMSLTGPIHGTDRTALQATLPILQQAALQLAEALSAGRY